MSRDHNYYVYIMMSINETLYIGVTNDLERRVSEHKYGLGKSFAHKYKCQKLVYYEYFTDINLAIKRGKQLKNWHREWKLNLIKEKNLHFIDLSIE